MPHGHSSEWEDLCSIPAFALDRHTSDLKSGPPVATLPGAFSYKVSAWTGWPGVSV